MSNMLIFAQEKEKESRSARKKAKISEAKRSEAKQSKKFLKPKQSTMKYDKIFPTFSTNLSVTPQWVCHCIYTQCCP